MKTLLSLLLASVLMVACSSSGNKDTTTQDSTAVADSVEQIEIDSTRNDSASEISEVSTDESSGDESELDAEFNSTSNEILEADLLIVYISSGGYEAQADITWRLDEDMQPRYYKQEYAVEGSEGSIEYYIENGIVVCAQSVENIVYEKWCIGANGTRTVEGEMDDEVTVLTATYGTMETAEMKRYLQELNSLIASLEVESEENGEVVLASEQTETYGDVESTSRVQVRLPKVVYEKLK